MEQGVKDADLVKKRWFQGISKRPKFKSKHKSKNSFYVNYEILKRVQNGFKGEKIGIVKTCQPLPKLKEGEKYSNSHISFGGKQWFLSIGYGKVFDVVDLSDISLGIDVGIKDLAVCSDGNVIKNINKSSKVKRLNKNLKREQRKLSRKIENNIKRYAKNRKPIYEKPLKEMRNIQKQNQAINNLQKKIKDIRVNHLHQASNDIVKTISYSDGNSKYQRNDEK